MNNKEPLISIILPTYNHDQFLRKSIQSVIEQTYNNWELIIIDNYSTDNTHNTVKSYIDKRIVYLKIQNNGIIAASRNAGIYESKGLYIAFLDADDWWLPNKLKECIKYIKDDNYDLLYHDLFVVERQNQIKFKKLAHTRKLNLPIFNDLLLNGNAILNSSVLVRKSILQDIGFLSCDINKVTWEDYDCWLRISKISNRFLYINKPLGYYWTAGGNMTNPDRDLNNACSIFNFYIKGTYNKIPSWILFSEGKALVKKGKKLEGISKFKTITLTKYSIKDFIKANFIILLISIRENI